MSASLASLSAAYVFSSFFASPFHSDQLPLPPSDAGRQERAMGVAAGAMAEGEAM